FGIGMNITREDMAVMIYRAYRLNVKKIGEYEKEFAFADDENISDYAKEAVYVLKNMSVINGTDNGNFAPKSLATRAEASKMLYGLIQD
ncbi:MAG: S-layer homology domain-containing protein, partial [Eubacteriales bacterium]|nr:S-layer homology domain-containing protein [Eubacteriales bacterium]